MRDISRILYLAGTLAASCAPVAENIQNQRAPVTDAQEQTQEKIELCCDEGVKQAIDVASWYVDKIAAQNNFTIQIVGTPDVLKPDAELFPKAFSFLRSHPQDFPGNAALIKKDVAYIVILSVTTPQRGNKIDRLVVALDSQNDVIGFAE